MSTVEPHRTARPLRRAERLYLAFLVEEAQGVPLAELLEREPEEAGELRRLAERRAELLEELADRRELGTGLRLAPPGDAAALHPALELFDAGLCRTVAARVGREEDAALPREAWICARLEHPGVLPVHELARDARGRVFLTSTKSRGETLAEALRRPEEGTPALVEVLARVAETLHFAHGCGVVHRALAANRVVRGSFGEVIVTGWDRARAPEGFDPALLEPRQHPELDLGDAEAEPAGAPEEPSGPLDATPDLVALGELLGEVLDRETVGHRTPPAELVAVRDRARAQAGTSGYASAAELADDLRAWLEHRVVRAHSSGPIGHLRAWTRRHRLAVACGSAGIALLLFLAAFPAWSRSQVRDAIGRLPDLQSLIELRDTQYDELWPPTAAGVGALEDWLARAKVFVDRRAEYEARLATLQERGEPVADEELREEYDLAIRLNASVSLASLESALRRYAEACPNPDPEPSPHAMDERSVLSRNLLETREAIEEYQSGWTPKPGRRPCRFDDPQDAWQYDTLLELLTVLDELEDPEPGKARLGEVEETLERLRALPDTPGLDEAWRLAIEAIADPRRMPRYRGRTLSRQFGLLPLEVNDQGLYEFAHLLSGDLPEEDTGGRWMVTERSGLVLVLVPPGELDAEEVDWFFLSKYELIQGQYRRLRAETSFFSPERDSATLRHPVEQIEFAKAEEFARRIGLELPTERQWEYAARGDPSEAWWSEGPDPRPPSPENLAGEADGHPKTAPVGSYAPSSLGLYDLIGNVSELCAGDPDRDAHPVRGGSWETVPAEVEATFRCLRASHTDSVGVRLMRRVSDE